MRIALLLSGPIRGFAHCLPSWRPFIEQVTDVYGVMAPTQGPVCLNYPVTKITANWAWENDDPSLHQWVSGRAMDQRPYYQHPAGVILGLHWYGRMKAFELMEQSGKQYDLVAYVRCDSFFTKPLDFSKSTPDKLWTPKPHCWGGLCDRIAVGSQENMAQYCNMYNYLNDDIDTLTIGNMEERLANYMTKGVMPLGLIDTDFHFVSADGTHRTIPPDQYGEYYLPQYQHFSQLEFR